MCEKWVAAVLFAAAVSRKDYDEKRLQTYRL